MKTTAQKTVLSTTSKVVKAKIQNYILECIDGESYQDTPPQTDEEKIKFLIDTYRNEYVFKNNLVYDKTYQNMFVNWVMGLPSCFNVEYRNYAILELVESWSGYVPTKKKESATIENFRYLIFRELITLAKKYNYDTKLFTL